MVNKSFLFKIIFFSLFLGILYISAKICLESELLTKIRNNEDIKILFLSTDKNKFYGAYLFNYSRSQNVVFICNLSRRTRFIKDRKDNKPLYLQDLFQRIYYQNKRVLWSTLKQYIKNVEDLYDIKIDYYMHFSQEQINGFDIDKRILLSGKATDAAILDKYLNLKPFLQKIQSLKYLRNFYRSILKQKVYKFANINSHDFWLIFNSFHSFYDLDMVFVGFHNIIMGDERFYLRDIFKGGKCRENTPIIAEVLNASKVKDLALNITRDLREQNVDVQIWGNYGKILKRNMVIDRSGDWQKAAYVAKYFRNLGNDVVFFSKKDKNAFVDVSLILGEKTI